MKTNKNINKNIIHTWYFSKTINRKSSSDTNLLGAWPIIHTTVHITDKPETNEDLIIISLS